MKIATRKYFFKTRKLNKIYVQEWGALDKAAVLFIHGFPGCSDHAQLMTGSPLLEGYRLIAMDRPGYGKSDRQRNLTPLGFAAQIRELLDSLKIDKIHLLHVSGGAPYGMALAYLIPDRVVRISAVSGIAPVTKRNFRFLSTAQKKNWITSRLVPSSVINIVLHRAFKRDIKRMDQMVFGNLDSFAGADRVVFTHPTIGPFLTESIHVSLSQGPGAVVDDMGVYSKSWGFPISAIKCPVTLWHGDADDVIHIGIAEQLGTELPSSSLKRTPNEGHFSVALNYRDQILEDLLLS